MTREELDAERRHLKELMHGVGRPGFAAAVERIVMAERAYVDRAAALAERERILKLLEKESAYMFSPEDLARFIARIRAGEL